MTSYEYVYPNFMDGRRIERKIVVPEGATACVIHGLHAEAVPKSLGYPDEIRSLTLEGMTLALAIQPQYRSFIAFLATIFGKPYYQASKALRSVMSTALLTGAEAVIHNGFLNPLITLAQAPDPWGCHKSYHSHCKAEGKSRAQMIEWVTEDVQRFGDQPVKAALDYCEHFNRGLTRENPLIVAFGHEPMNSLWARQNGVAMEDLGLNLMQAYVIFLDGKHNVLSVQKFYPETSFFTNHNPT